MRQLTQNAIQLEDGTILYSRSEHDFQQNGNYFVDGGNDYARIGYPDNPTHKELYLYSDSSFEEIKSKMLWGTRGKSGTDRIKWVKLCDCEVDHLKAILEQLNNRGGTSKTRIDVIQSLIIEKSRKLKLSKLLKNE